MAGLYGSKGSGNTQTELDGLRTVDGLIVLVDLSDKPQSNDRKAKISNMNVSRGFSIRGMDKTSVRKGHTGYDNKENTDQPFEPDNWNFVRHKIGGRADRPWAMRVISDNQAPHDGSGAPEPKSQAQKNRSTMIIDQRGSQYMGAMHDLLLVEIINQVVKVKPGRRLRYNGAGVNRRLIEDDTIKTKGGKAPQDEGHLMLNTSWEAGFVSDTKRIGQLSQILTFVKDARSMADKITTPLQAESFGDNGAGSSYGQVALRSDTFIHSGLITFVKTSGVPRTPNPDIATGPLGLTDWDLDDWLCDGPLAKSKKDIGKPAPRKLPGEGPPGKPRRPCIPLPGAFYYSRNLTLLPASDFMERNGQEDNDHIMAGGGIFGDLLDPRHCVRPYALLDLDKVPIRIPTPCETPEDDDEAEPDDLPKEETGKEDGGDKPKIETPSARSEESQTNDRLERAGQKIQDHINTVQLSPPFNEIPAFNLAPLGLTVEATAQAINLLICHQNSIVIRRILEAEICPEKLPEVETVRFTDVERVGDGELSMDVGILAGEDIARGDVVAINTETGLAVRAIGDVSDGLLTTDSTKDRILGVAREDFSKDDRIDNLNTAHGRIFLVNFVSGLSLSVGDIAFVANSVTNIPGKATNLRPATVNADDANGVAMKVQRLGIVVDADCYGDLGVAAVLWAPVEECPECTTDGGGGPIE